MEKEGGPTPRLIMMVLVIIKIQKTYEKTT